MTLRHSVGRSGCSGVFGAAVGCRRSACHQPPVVQWPSGRPSGPGFLMDGGAHCQVRQSVHGVADACHGRAPPLLSFILRKRSGSLASRAGPSGLVAQWPSGPGDGSVESGSRPGLHQPICPRVAFSHRQQCQVGNVYHKPCHAAK